MTDLQLDGVEAEDHPGAEPGADDDVAELGDIEPADADDVRGGGLWANHNETLVLDAG